MRTGAMPTFRARRYRKERGADQAEASTGDKPSGKRFHEKVQGLLGLGDAASDPKEIIPISTIPASRQDEKGEPSKEASQAGDARERDPVVASSNREESRSRRPSSSRRREDSDLVSKRRRSEPEERRPSRSNSDSRGARAPWSFRHSKEGSILEDEEGLSRLFRHLKPDSWEFPPEKEMHGGEDYRRTCSLFGQAFSAMNKSFIRYEEEIREAPSKEIMGKVEESCAEANRLHAETKLKLEAVEKMNVEQKKEILTLRKEQEESKLMQSILESRSHALITEKSALQEKVNELTAQIETETKRAAKAAKREMIDSYKSILEAIKVKFEKRKLAAKAQVRVQEIQVNLELLEDIIGGKIQNLEGERDYLRDVELPARNKKLAERAVSDFSLGKLDLPQVSDGSNAPLVVDPVSGVPHLLDPHGTNVAPPEPKETGEAQPEENAEKAGATEEQEQLMDTDAP